MGKEEKLQSDIAIAHSQRYPEKFGQLFHISNERNNKIQAYKARSIGIVPGVADFIYISKEFNIATELKVPASRHLVSHVKSQLRWAKVWEKQGNEWRLCRTKEEALSCYEGDFQGLTRAQVKDMVKQVKTKTIKF
jgi:hypothetical protein